MDYDGATDGNSDFDDEFTVSVDLTGIDASSFPDVPTIVSPTADAAFPAGNRSITIDWNPVSDADFYFVGVDGFGEADLPASQTELTIDFLPTGIDLLGYVGGAQGA